LAAIGLSSDNPIESGLKVRLDGTSSVGATEFYWFAGSDLIATGPVFYNNSFTIGPKQFDLKLRVYNASGTAGPDVTKRVYVKGGMELVTQLNFSTPLGAPAGVTPVGSQLWATIYSPYTDPNVYTSNFSSPMSQTPLQAVPITTTVTSVTSYQPAKDRAFVIIVERPTFYGLARVAIRIANPVAPTLIGRIESDQLGGEFLLTVSILGKWLFVSTHTDPYPGRLYVFDLTPLNYSEGPIMPQFVTRIDTPMYDEPSTMIPSSVGVLTVRSWRPRVYFVDARGEMPFLLDFWIGLEGETLDYGSASQGL